MISSLAIECYNAFVDPAVDAGLPEVCCVVSVTPLLRELLVRAASLPLLYEEGGACLKNPSTMLPLTTCAKNFQLPSSSRSPNTNAEL